MSVGTEHLKGTSMQHSDHMGKNCEIELMVETYSKDKLELLGSITHEI